LERYEILPNHATYITGGVIQCLPFRPVYLGSMSRDVHKLRI
jgi:hypothetical protein